MICPKCGVEMRAKVTHDQFDGDYNWAICDCGHFRPIPQTTAFDVLFFRASVSRMLAA